jgi:hypothetical protein
MTFSTANSPRRTKFTQNEKEGITTRKHPPWRIHREEIAANYTNLTNYANQRNEKKF